MSEKNKDELIEAQKQIIGILFEIIKRLQANNNLDEEYFQIIASNDNKKSQRIAELLEERKTNTEIVRKLLKQIEI